MLMLDECSLSMNSNAHMKMSKRWKFSSSEKILRGNSIFRINYLTDSFLVYLMFFKKIETAYYPGLLHNVLSHLRVRITKVSKKETIKKAVPFIIRIKVVYKVVDNKLVLIVIYSKMLQMVDIII